MSTTQDNLKWESRYKLLEEFKDVNGPRNFRFKDKRLGIWCSRQRVLRRKGKMSEERIKKLEKLGFIW
ncbi:Helicase associated domain protein [bacterium]|nr:Helicase associated domain protein [bacterium]|tara:strand:+ start:15434 stop:15637 length:204 start_codon:yes stop_codon:yes gene_type:complete